MSAVQPHEAAFFAVVAVAVVGALAWILSGRWR